MVGYGESDVGVSIISYTMERNTFIDYSPAVGTDSMVWVTKPPQKLSGASNLLRYYISNIVPTKYFYKSVKMYGGTCF